MWLSLAQPAIPTRPVGCPGVGKPLGQYPCSYGHTLLRGKEPDPNVEDRGIARAEADGGERQKCREEVGSVVQRVERLPSIGEALG